MKIETLENVTLKEISEAFNAAFSDYIVKLQLSESQLANKITIENIKLDLSFGTYENGKLVGFILHGIDNFNNCLVAYNAGTGVIPEYRGKRIPELIYSTAFKSLEEKGIHKHQLEVITTNEKAIRICFRKKPDGFSKLQFERISELRALENR